VPDRIDVCEVVRRYGGSARWQDILRYSTGHSVRRAVAAGSLRRVSQGVYALPQTLPAYSAAEAMKGLVSHRSAAAHWLMDGLVPDESAHVTVPSRARPRFMRRIQVHFIDVPAEEQRDGVTSPCRTVLDCALTLPFAQALAIADSALRRGLVTGDDLVRAASTRLGPGRRRIMRVATAADGRADNPFESALRAIIIEAGITGFEPQLGVPEMGARADLGNPHLRTLIEADSFAFHGTRDALTRDCRRYDEFVRHGWRVLRFSWEQVMFEPEWVASVIRDTCAVAGREKSRSKSRKRARAPGCGELDRDFLRGQLRK
jgi:very-short-patch-repair endonuclease